MNLCRSVAPQGIDMAIAQPTDAERAATAPALVREAAASATEDSVGPPPEATLPSAQPPAQGVIDTEGGAAAPGCTAADTCRQGYRVVQGSRGSTTTPLHAPAGGSDSPAKAHPALRFSQRPQCLPADTTGPTVSHAR